MPLLANSLMTALLRLPGACWLPAFGCAVGRTFSPSTPYPVHSADSAAIASPRLRSECSEP